MLRWVIKVERQHRLRLTPDIVAQIPWLAAASVPLTVFGKIAEYGQFRILPPGSQQQRQYEQLAERLAAIDPNDDASSTLVDLARYTANAVPLTFSRERNRVTVVLPRELRALGVVPSKGENAVVFAFGGHVEIWCADTLAKHLRSLDRKLEDLLEESADDLGGQKE